MRPLRMLSLFSGMGAFEKALERMGCPHEVVGWSEVDEGACLAWRALHGDAPALGDVRGLDATALEGGVDLLTYGFPCQDISLAGRKRGFGKDGEQTRSGLFYEAVRVIRECRPTVAIAENVKNLLSRSMTAERAEVFSQLEAAGYETYCALLNSKDFGVPQSRERAFFVSIRSDVARGFAFPEGRGLSKRLLDVLDGNVEAAWYLSEKRLDSVRYDNSEPHSLKFRTGTEQGWVEARVGDSLSLAYPHSKNRRGRVMRQCCMTLMCTPNEAVVVSEEPPQVRRITPWEACRLMGFEDADYQAMKAAGMSDTQIFKCCGNSIVVDVLVALLTELLDQYREELMG